MRSQSWRSLVAGVAAGVMALGVAAPLQAAVFARSSLQVRNISPDEAFLYPGPYRFYADGGLEVSWGPGTDWWDGSGVNCWYDCVNYVAGGGVSDVSPGHPQDYVGAVAHSGGDNFGPFNLAYLAADTAAEMNLDSLGSYASGVSHAQLEGTWRTIEQVTFGFDVTGSLLATSDDLGGVGGASFSWVAQVYDGGSLIAEFAPEALNRTVGVTGVGTDSYTIDQHFAFTVTGLTVGRNYTLVTRLGSAVAGRLDEPPPPPPGVPEPATWALMLLGFGALGTALRRRPARELPDPAI